MKLNLAYAYALEELKKRKAKAKKLKSWVTALTLSLFPAQREFVQCNDQLVAALCTRRAGKTHGAAARLLLDAQRVPNSAALYLALTRKSAKRLLWPKLKESARTYDIPLKFNESELTAYLPNGSCIILYGADQENLGERLRGDAYCVVVIDEAASFGEHLQYLVDDILLPALMDHQGSLVLIGTPGPIPFGVFYDATTDLTRGWNVHKWTVYDNPHLPHAKKWVAKLKKTKKWTDDNPTYLREYQGIWTSDPSNLIYRYCPNKNDIDELPQISDEFEYVLGVDLGYEDPFAMTVIAFSENHSKAYIVHSEHHSHWTPTQWAERIKEVQKRYNVFNTVVDAGALGKAIVEDLNARFELGLNPADKSQKMATIELMNGELTAERLMVLPGNQNLTNQMRILSKDKTGKKEDPTLPNDMCIAEGTKITTSIGDVNIEDVEPGMLVLTSKGYRKVIRKLNKGVKEVYRLNIGENQLMATEEHPIMTSHGWKEVKHLNRGDLILCQKSIKSNMMVFGGTEICQNIHTTKEFLITVKNNALNFCIDINGKNSKVKYLKNILFTIGMATKVITESKISNVLVTKTIFKSILQKSERLKQENIAKELEKKLQIGIGLRLVRNGTKSTIKCLSEKIEPKLKQCVRFVVNITKQIPLYLRKNGFARTSVTPRKEENQASIISNSLANGAVKNSSEINTQSRSFAHYPVLQITAMPPEKVYDLEIEDQHEYFANSILVHNCDSTLYAWREARNYMYIEPEPQPEYGSDEYNEMIDREQEESLAEHFESDKSIFDNDDVGEFVA